MKNASVPQQSSQDLCLSCGLCCDGTIFRTVEIDDLPAILRHKSAGIAFNIVNEDKNAKPIFTQPCAAFREGCCKIYPDRPANCRNFKCDLLKAYIGNKTDFAAASVVIKKAKDQKNAILQRVAETGLPLKSGNVVFDLYDEAFALWKNLEPGELKNKFGDIILRIAALRFYISANFKDLEKTDRNAKSGA